MLYLLDTANLNEIKDACDYYPIDGVTTNPSIIAKEGKSLILALKEIKSIIQKKALHAQVMSSTAEEMIKEASHMADEIKDNFYVKVPVTKEGIKAMAFLKKKGFNVTATAIYSPTQALVAARAGADFVAPYVNRIDNLCADGVGTVSDIAKLFKSHNLPSKILAASFKNIGQIHNCLLNGADTVTVPYELMEKLIDHPLTDKALKDFASDWKKAFG